MRQNPIPDDKGLTLAWVRALTERGAPDLRRGVDPPALERGGAAVEAVLKVAGRARRLAAADWADTTVSDSGTIVRTDHADPACPVAVRCETLAPGTPLDHAAAAIPAVFLFLTLSNRAATPVTAALTLRLRAAGAVRTRRLPGARRRQSAGGLALETPDPLTPIVLPPRATRTVVAVVAWAGGPFADPDAACAHASRHAARLVGDARRWHAVLTDTTLPHWLVDAAVADLRALASDPDRDTPARAALYPGAVLAAPETAGGGVDVRARTVLEILRAVRTHPDPRLARAAWPRAKRHLDALLARDADGDGLLDGPQENALGAPWFGAVPWLSGLFVAALQAGGEMAARMGDDAFARRCRERARAGAAALDTRLFRDGAYRHRPDPAHPDAPGSGDAVFAQSLRGPAAARLLGLPDLLDPAHVQTALETLYRVNFAPDLDAWRERRRPDGGLKPGRAGLVLAVGDTAGARPLPAFDLPWPGSEMAAAAHLVGIGRTQAGLTLARAAALRGETTGAWAVLLAVTGVVGDAAAGWLSVDPKTTPDLFRGPFVAGGGWGIYTQRLEDGAQRHSLEVRGGRLKVERIEVPRASGFTPTQILARTRGGATGARLTVRDRRVEIRLEPALGLAAGETLYLSLV